jgi:hypothetical protein
MVSKNKLHVIYLKVLGIFCILSKYLMVTAQPQPVITLHDGHIGLLERLMETTYRGIIFKFTTI